MFENGMLSLSRRGRTSFDGGGGVAFEKKKTTHLHSLKFSLLLLVFPLLISFSVLAKALASSFLESSSSRAMSAALFAGGRGGAAAAAAAAASIGKPSASLSTAPASATRPHLASSRRAESSLHRYDFLRCCLREWIDTAISSSLLARILVQRIPGACPTRGKAKKEMNDDAGNDDRRRSFAEERHPSPCRLLLAIPRTLPLSRAAVMEDHAVVCER